MSIDYEPGRRRYRVRWREHRSQRSRRFLNRADAEAFAVSVQPAPEPPPAAPPAEPDGSGVYCHRPRGRRRIASPPEGVVLRKRISTTRTGPNIVSVTDTKSLWASFRFAASASPRSRPMVTWYGPGRRDALRSFAVKAPYAFSYWTDISGLAAGRWRAILRAGHKTVSTLTARVG